ncbi:MAG: hypothetical protein OXE57_09000, partial [Alphaproteobacteria bacterium]|nr:hypothetical protein [Alphaproteobacteria bacterium]
MLLGALLAAATPAAAQPFTAWQSKLTVDVATVRVNNVDTTYKGCNDQGRLDDCSTALSRNMSFVFRGKTYTVGAIEYDGQSVRVEPFTSNNELLPLEEFALYLNGERYRAHSRVNQAYHYTTGAVWETTPSEPVEVKLHWEGSFPPDPATPMLSEVLNSATNTTLSFEIGCVSGHVTDYILWVTRPNSRLEPGAHYFSP